MKYYIYAHKRKTDGTVFYVGKGSIARSKTTSSRTDYWKRTVSKYGYDVVIVKSFDDEQDAYDYEIKAIKILRWIGCRLCNVANGGEGGLSGRKLKPEHVEKLRTAKLGKKQKPKWAKRSATLRCGAKNTKEHIEATARAKRRKVINSNGDIFESATQAAVKMAEATGAKPSQGNISTCARGTRNEAYGLSWSYDIEVKPEPPKAKKKKVKNITTGVVYESLYEAAEKHSVSYQGISLSIKKGTLCKSCKWEYTA